MDRSSASVRLMSTRGVKVLNRRGGATRHLGLLITGGATLPRSILTGVSDFTRGWGTFGGSETSFLSRNSEYAGTQNGQFLDT
jgi:hypothetical protein